MALGDQIVGNMTKKYEGQVPLPRPLGVLVLCESFVFTAIFRSLKKPVWIQHEEWAAGGGNCFQIPASETQHPPSLPCYYQDG